MELLFREGRWHGREYVLPSHEWDDLEARGVTVDMLALERRGLVLALFTGSPTPGTVLEFGIGLAADEIEAVRARVPAGSTRKQEEGLLRFEDPFGFVWTMYEPEVPFVSVLPPLPDGEVAV